MDFSTFQTVISFYCVTDPGYDRVSVDDEGGEDEAQAWMLNIPLKQDTGT